MKTHFLLLLAACLPGALMADLPSEATVTQFPGTQEVDSLACDGQGNIYVGDHFSQEIFKYSATGALLSVEAEGDDPVAIGYPASMDASENGMLAVADDVNNVLWIFGAGAVPTRIGAGSQGAVYAPDTVLTASTELPP